MGDENGALDPPRILPPAAVEAIDRLNEAELRAAIDYARERRNAIHPNVTEQIEPGPGEAIVRVEERPGYTEVVKREPCADGCDGCPHGPFLYHVREEAHPGGEASLHWEYLGRIREE